MTKNCITSKYCHISVCGRWNWISGDVILFKNKKKQINFHFTKDVDERIDTKLYSFHSNGLITNCD